MKKRSRGLHSTPTIGQMKLKVSNMAKAGANPMKHLLVEIPRILGVNTTSKIYSQHFTRILEVNTISKIN